VWVVTQSAFEAMCSPKNDKDVVFEIALFKDGTGMYRDEYLQGVVSKQLGERVQAKLQKVFGSDCYVKAHFYGGMPTIEDLMESYEGKVSVKDCLKNITVEEYYKLDENPYLSLWIVVNKERLDNNEAQTKAEYGCLSELFDNEPMQEGGCGCYFVDERMLNECKNYFYKMNKGDTGEFNRIVEGGTEFGFGFDYGNIRESFEDYNEIRKEVRINE